MVAPVKIVRLPKQVQTPTVQQKPGVKIIIFANLNIFAIPKVIERFFAKHWFKIAKWYLGRRIDIRSNQALNCYVIGASFVQATKHRPGFPDAVLRKNEHFISNSVCLQLVCQLNHAFKSAGMYQIVGIKNCDPVTSCNIQRPVACSTGAPVNGRVYQPHPRVCCDD